MPKNSLEERLRWVLPIYNKEIKLKEAAKICPYGKRTLERWISAYRRLRTKGLFVSSTRPKTNPKDTPIWIKEKIVEMRKSTRLSALKLHWKLQKEGINIHPRTIGKIIKKEKLVRRYRIRRVKYQYVKTLLKPGDLVEIDIKYVPRKLENRRYYQYTAIDCASRWRLLKAYDEISNLNSSDFVKELIKVAWFRVKAIKTDNGCCFTNRYMGYLKSADPYNPRLHSFDLLCNELGIEHYLIDPGKPAQNGKVERSHRTDQEMFYDRVGFRNFEELCYKMKLWNMFYNDLEHCGLNGKTPNQFLNLNVKYIPPKVCA